MTACPFCYSTIPSAATKCAACGSNVGDIVVCVSCAEPVRVAAQTCPFCGSDPHPPSYDELELAREPWIVEASPFGAAITSQSLTALVYPPVLTVTPDEIRVRRKLFFGLRTMEQKISVQRIASVRAIDGVIWSQLVIETFGGAVGDLSISGLDKEEARQTARVVERLSQVKSGRRSREN